ncbi:MAG: undecaprenyl/decaprenyl-phosphate alpha-N-acetylglucosaminyl 1-phosphate transferase [Anaerolineales bacterium]|nr:undecaprenyl/decaprenyl-phosphate alpha-N-acetylglucosaminyl 1-phosphate transferase [Anaerolineales bacterium]
MADYTSSASFWFEAILLSSILVAVFAFLGIIFTRRMGLLDFPGSAPHKTHSVPVPIAGGMALVGALLISGWIFETYRDPAVMATLGGGLIVFIFGLWDDIRGMSPVVKLMGQVLAAVVLIRLGVSIKIFHSPEFFISGHGLLFSGLNFIATILWVVGLTNAFNFVDSMDGLALGLGGMAAAFFMVVTLDSGQIDLSRISALLLGVCIGLYFFNSSPAHLFLGDSGAQSLGFVLASLGIAFHPLDVNQASSWFVPIMLLAVPIFDTTLVVFSRLRRRKAVYKASIDHTYHRLLSMGLSSSRAVLLMQLTALFLGCLAFLVLPYSPLLSNTVFVSVVIAGFILLLLLDDRKRWG